jgi:hypothetical protein
MTDRYTSIAGPTMHTGWMKKISLLEQQMLKALRDITELQKQVKALEDAERVRPNPQEFIYSPMVKEPTPVTLFEAYPPPPIKRGPGRPRKNP